MLERVLQRPTVLVLPTSFRARVHVIAPDLWTIRSFTADVPSPPIVTSEATGDTALTPSLEEQEWARLIASGDYESINAKDGDRAIDAALRRGSVSSIRSIGEQVRGVVFHGELGPTPQELGRHLQHLREAAGLTVEQLAERAGLPRERVVLFESGSVDPGLDDLTFYARGLNMPLSAVFRSWERKLR